MTASGATRLPMRVFAGLPVSDGIAIGRAVSVLSRSIEIIRFPIAEENLEAELLRFRTAVEQTRSEIEHTADNAGTTLGDEMRAIFHAHALILADPLFLGQIERVVRQERVNSDWAVHQAAEELAARFAKMDDPYLRERGHDIEDVSRQLLRALQGVGHHELAELGENVVVVADDLTPAEAIRLGRASVVGFAVETGGRTSHTSIVARSLNLPAVCALTNVTGMVTTDDLVILDGTQGTLILHPTEEVLEQYAQRRSEQARRAVVTAESRSLPAITRDGVGIELMANVDLPEELAELERHGARGIGLYRSEFLYMETEPRLPTEDEHYALYRRLVDAATPFPAVIRTYDLGGRKLARDMMHLDEENPVLGLRGIRLTLARPQIFRTQLRGLLRASAHGDVWAMAPLVSRVEEIRQLRSLLEELMADLASEGLEFSRSLRVGVMIEVPAAALIAEALARESDFFAIGTNDLVQYSLAVDRNNRHVADLYQPLHPAILRMVRFTVTAADSAGIPVSLCGEMAADPRCVPLLLGLGLRRLSVNPRKVPAIKALVRRVSLAAAEGCVARCVKLGSAVEVEQELSALLADLPSPEPA